MTFIKYVIHHTYTQKHQYNLAKNNLFFFPCFSWGQKKIIMGKSFKSQMNDVLLHVEPISANMVCVCFFLFRLIQITHILCTAETLNAKQNKLKRWTFTWSDEMSIFYAFLAMHFVHIRKQRKHSKLFNNACSSDTMEVDSICVSFPEHSFFAHRNHLFEMIKQKKKW